MSADLEVLLNDLVMKAERTNAEFRHEVANAKRVEEATQQIRRLNAMAFNEALLLMQSMPQVFQQQVPAPTGQGHMAMIDAIGESFGDQKRWVG